MAPATPLRRLVALLFLFAAPAARAEFDTFKAVIGLDDGMLGRSATIRFFVERDGKRVLGTDVMRPGDPARPVEIPLEGAKELRLIVDDAGDGHGGDWGDWADARFVDSKTGDVLFLSDLNAVVEKEWIPTRMDRNLIQNPLMLNGTVYARGLGADSGSSMLYKDWQALWEARQTEAQKTESDAAAKLGARAVLAGRPAPGLRVVVGGEPWNGEKPFPVKEGQSLSLIWSRPAGEIVVGRDAPTGITLAGVPLERLTPDRIEHLSGATPPAPRRGEPPVTLDGRPYFGGLSAGAPVRLTWAHPLADVQNQLQIPHQKRDRHLLGRVGLDRRESNSIGTVRFLVLFDGRVVFDSGIVTTRSRPVEMQIPFTDPKEVRLVVSDAGDGGYGDAADWVDLRGPDSSGARHLFLSAFRPWSWRQNWGAPQHDRAVSGDSMLLPGPPFRRGLGIAAPSEVVYRGLGAAIARREREMAALEKLGWSGNRFAARVFDPAAARKSLEAMVRDDPELADAHYALARLANDTGDREQTETQLKRLLDVGISASPAVRAAAQWDLREIRAGRPMSASLDKNRPQSSDASLIESTDLAALLSEPRTLTMSGGWGQQQAAVVRFTVRAGLAQKPVRVLVASAGLEVRAWLFPGREIPPEAERRSRAVATAMGRNPTLHSKLAAGEYTLLIEHDPARDGVLLPFKIGLCCSPDAVEQAKVREEWSYVIQNDGSARVQMRVDVPTVILVPHTAEEVAFADARTITLPSAFEYDSQLDIPYTQGNTVLIAPQTGKTAQVSFVWRDAAYDVPNTHYASDHAKKHFFASLRGIDPESEVHVAVTLPMTVTKVTRTAPEIAPDAENVYRWTLAPDRSAILEAENPSLESKWISATHRHMTISLPDTAEYRKWLPRYNDMLARIYDRQTYLMGDYETAEERFLYVTGPAQLSGYGGATWAEPTLSETWIACTGRVGEYNFLAQPGGDGVEAHELKWVHLPGWQPDGPRWLKRGTTIWLEEQGKLAGGTSFPDQWAWTELMPKAAQYRDRFHGPGGGTVWMSEEEIGKLPSADRLLTDAMDWYIVNALHARYGDSFWNRFWKYERDNPAQWKEMDEAGKTRRVVEDIVQLTNDTTIRAQFAEWGFGGRDFLGLD